MNVSLKIWKQQDTVGKNDCLNPAGWPRDPKVDMTSLTAEVLQESEMPGAADVQMSSGTAQWSAFLNC